MCKNGGKKVHGPARRTTENGREIVYSFERTKAPLHTHTHTHTHLYVHGTGYVWGLVFRSMNFSLVGKEEPKKKREDGERCLAFCSAFDTQLWLISMFRGQGVARRVYHNKTVCRFVCAHAQEELELANIRVSVFISYETVSNLEHWQRNLELRGNTSFLFWFWTPLCKEFSKEAFKVCQQMTLCTDKLVFVFL